MELDDRPGQRLGHLESFKNRASFLLKDSLKIARLALVDVSAAELITEDATNADEWGPTTKAMADICGVIYSSEDYLRVVQVLHKRFALSAKKYWRQIHKSLILLEYLLCHGPEHLVMEFREDKKRFEELTRFVYVDWTGIDRGSALQRRAKHVLHLLLDEAFYKQERTRAQRISKGISGFGSQSVCRRSPRGREIFPGNSKSSDRSDSMEHDQSRAEDDDDDEDSSTLLVDENDDQHGGFKPKKTFNIADAVSSPSSQSKSSWDGAFAASPPRDSPNGSGRSTCHCEESPTSVLPTPGRKLQTAPDTTENNNNNSPRSLQKLPPPPPVAEYKSLSTPRSPLRSASSRAPQRKQQPGSLRPARAMPDLIII